MPVSKTLAYYRNRVALQSRYHPGSPELDAAKRDLMAAKLAQHIEQVTSTPPSLSDDQRAQLAALLYPVTA